MERENYYVICKKCGHTYITSTQSQPKIVKCPVCDKTTTVLPRRYK